MKKYLFLLILIFLISFSNVFASPPDIKAKSAILAAINSEQILFEKNSAERVYPSGLTKLVTALVAYEKSGMDEIVTVPQNIKEYLTYLEPSMNLKPGEQITTGSLISAITVGSANDAAIAIAIHCGGSIEGFVAMMNERAKSLGLSNTNFVNATGNHNIEHYTTAVDMLKIYRQMCNTPKLKEILNTQNANIPPTNIQPKRTFWTSNHLISRYIETKYIYENARGGKTASSSAGGYSIVTNGKRYETELICIVFGSILDEGVNYSLVEAKNLFEYGFNDFILKTIVSGGDIISEIKVKNSATSDHLLLYTFNGLKCFILRDDKIESIQKELKIPKFISAPITKDQIIGSIDYSYLGKYVGKVDVAASNSLSLNPIKYAGNSILWFFNLKYVKLTYGIILSIVLIYIGIVFYIINKSIKRKKR